MLPKITAFLSIALLLIPVCLSRAQDSSAFFDAYKKAASEAVSITAKVSCRTYLDDELQPARINGVATWGGGSRPFMVLTLFRLDSSKDTSETFLVVGRDDSIRMVDCARGQYFDENMAHCGSALLSLKLNIVFILLCEPQVLDLFRGMPANFSEVAISSGRALKFTGDDSACHAELTFDKETYLPLKVERAVKAQDGRSFRTVLEISDLVISKAKLPDVVFEINGAFGFPTVPFDPTGLTSLDKAPPFEVVTLDGSRFNLDEHSGKWVFLCFRASCDRLRGESEACFDRICDTVRARGGFFINVVPYNYGVDQSSINSLSSTCRSDVLTRIYAVKNAGLPFVVVISPEGRVSNVFMGYIPDVSERAFDDFIDKNLPADSVK